MLPRRALAAGHLTSVLVTLERLQLGATDRRGQAAARSRRRIRKRGLVVLISDLLDDPERVIEGLKHFRYRGTK